MQRIPDYFDHTFIINLPERTDRLAAVYEEFTELGYWIDNPNAQITVFPALKFDDADGFPSTGYRGSFSSHLAVIERAREMGLRNVLICEDDLKFTNATREEMKKILAQIPDQWDILYFGYLSPKLDLPNGLHAYSKGTIGGHFYAVNGPFFDTLIDYMRACRERPPGHPEGGRMGRDGTFGHLLIVRPETRAFIAAPNLATQRSSRSSIRPSYVDKIPLLAPLAGVVRRIAS